MDIDFKKLAPWNWFKKEQEEQQSTASLPVQRNDLPVAGGPVSPILQLHREIDRLFDDAFRGFGFQKLAMPRWPSDWPGMLKPAPHNASDTSIRSAGQFLEAAGGNAPSNGAGALAPILRPDGV